MFLLEDVLALESRALYRDVRVAACPSVEKVLISAGVESMRSGAAPWSHRISRSAVRFIPTRVSIFSGLQ